MVAEMVETQTRAVEAVELSAVALRDALGACLLSVGRDDTLPVLTTVHVVSDGSTVTFTSTDRFRLTRVSVPTVADAGTGPAFDVLVVADDVKRLVTAIKETAKMAERNRLKSGAQLAVEGDRLVLRDWYGGVTSGRTFEGEFPRVDSIIDGLSVPDEHTEPTAHTVAFNPAFMADLCKMPGRLRGGRRSVADGPVKLSFPGGPDKPCVSRWSHCDDDAVEFVHVIMPVRLPAK